MSQLPIIYAKISQQSDCKIGCQQPLAAARTLTHIKVALEARALKTKNEALLAC